jgi:glycogen(starch) synthase
MTPGVSIVINTMNRAESLRRALLSLRQLDYPVLEVIVVVGPSTDDTDTVVAEFEGQLKVGCCDVPNLSASRNIGIRLASGDLVAFIDDDSVPDPWWLDDVVPAFEDEEVAAAGGPVYDFDGATLFSRYSLVDIHGDAFIWNEGPDPSRLLAAPLTDLILYPIGTNAVYRRSMLTAIGGFDEAFTYYLEESDACRRLINRGWVVQACERGFVYHLRDPSAIRTAERVTRDLYQPLKSRLYFALRHARPRVGLKEVLLRYDSAVDRFRQDCLRCLQNGLLESVHLEQFERDAVRVHDDAFDVAGQEPKIRDRGWFDQEERFLLLERPSPPRRLHLCIVTQEYLPKQLNGIGRLSHELGTALARRGHVVRIVAESDSTESVDLENGVWVHRILTRPTLPPSALDAPAQIWDFSASVLRELRRIDDMHPVDIVQMPNWNSEGIAVLEDGTFTSVLGLHTPLQTVARIDPRTDPQDPYTRQLLTLERQCYEHATAFLACGPASLDQIEQEYGIELPRERIGFVPFGIRDRGNSEPLGVPGRVNVLFVGRLEARKGIDTFLEAVAILLPEVPEVVFTIVGNDSIPSESGRTYREEFEGTVEPRLRDGRVVFRGIVPDDELDRYYAGCDVFVAPSRSESFGLILLEAMREGKPVIAGDVGGMREVVEHELNGLLVPPDDVQELADALRCLVKSAALRERFGRHSRELFEERFTAARMALGYERFCLSLLPAKLAR